MEQTSKTDDLLKELNFYKMAIDSSSDGICLATNEGKHLYHNRAFSNLFGYQTPDELVRAGGPSAAYVDANVAFEIFNNILKGKNWSGEVQMLTKDRKKLDIFIRADAVKDESGKVLGVFGVHTDITEKKRIEFELEDRMERLEENNKQMMSREMKIIELKNRIKDIEGKIRKLEK